MNRAISVNFRAVSLRKIGQDGPNSLCMALVLVGWTSAVLGVLTSGCTRSSGRVTLTLSATTRHPPAKQPPTSPHPLDPGRRFNYHRSISRTNKQREREEKPIEMMIFAS